MSGLQKIKDELKRCKTSKSLGLLSMCVGKIDDYTWKATFEGPKKTGYQGGLFRLVIRIPSNYPDSCPEIRFKNPVFHPNVSESKSSDYPEGYHICLDYINHWKSENTIEEALIGIFQLMVRPTPGSGYSNTARTLLKDLNDNWNDEKYKTKCNEWVRKYSTINNN